MEMEEIIRRLKEENKKIVTTNGIFDILHAGHVTYIEEAKRLGDVLIIAINSDDSTKRIKGDKRPINSQENRKKMLLALKAVDYVFIFDEDDPKEILSKIKPDIHVKAKDYTMDEIIEKDVVEENGGQVVLLDIVESISTTDIIKKIIEVYK